MRIVWYRFRATFGRRWPGYAAIVLLIGFVGGLAMAAVAGARRTQSSFPAFLASTNPSDMTLTRVGPGVDARDDSRLLSEISHLPHVKRVERAVVPIGFELGSDGQGLGFLATVGLSGGADGLFFEQDRAVAIEGRMADPRRADEMVLTPDAARALRKDVGDVIPMGFWTLAQQGAVPFFEPPPVEPHVRVDVKVVGIVVLNSTVVQDDINRYPAPALFTPTLMHRLEQCPTSCMLPGWIVALTVDSNRNIDAVEHEVEAALPPLSFPLLLRTSIVETKVQHAIKPESIALGVFGAISALAMLLIAGQALGRQLRHGADDLDPLRALGAGPAVTSTDGLTGAVGAIVLGSIVAAAVAVALSPLAPLGPVRRVYPSRGIVFDWTVLGLGTVLPVVVLSAFAGVVAFRQAPHRAYGGSQQAAARGSRLARAGAAWGLPVPAVAGVRLALEPGRGRSAVPVRSALVATGLAVVTVVATLVFGSSLDTLISHSSLYGWNWSYALQAAHNGPIPPETRAALGNDPDVAAWTGVTMLPLVHVDAQLVPAFMQVPNAPVTPPLLSGQAIDGRNQIILGAATLAQLHKHVGDSVVVSLGRPTDRPLRIAPARFRIVGTATFPTIGLYRDRNTSMSAGALIADTPEPRNLEFTQIRQAQYGPLNGPTMALVRDAARSTTRGRLGETATDRRSGQREQDHAGQRLDDQGVARPAAGGDRELSNHGQHARAARHCPRNRSDRCARAHAGDLGTTPTTRPRALEDARPHPSPARRHRRRASVGHRAHRHPRRCAHRCRRRPMVVDPLRAEHLRGVPAHRAGVGNRLRRHWRAHSRQPRRRRARTPSRPDTERTAAPRGMSTSSRDPGCVESLVSNICSLGFPGVQPHELENLRRSLAMLNPGATASLSREEAMRLITEVADLQARLERLRVGLSALVEAAGDGEVRR